MSRSLAVCAALCLLGATRADESTLKFTDVTQAAGLVEPLAGIMGHGAAWGDLDGDGLLDLYVGGFSDRPAADYAPASGPVSNRLFRNLGGGRFERVAGAADLFARTSGAVFADLDGDGALELYVSNNAVRSGKQAGEPQRSAALLHSRLFRNEGGRLLDVSAASGACPESLFSARNVGVLDFDRDGRLDLFLVEDRLRSKGRARSVLLRNLGGLRFEDVTTQAGLPDDLFGLGLAIADLNDDRRPDLFVAHSDRLFLSQPDGTWREAIELRETFAWQPADDEDWPCGAAFGDLDGDGRLDLVVSAHHAPARQRVFLNTGLRQGVPGFRDVTREAGLAEPVPVKCPHVELQDFDGDGRLEIYLSAAWLEGDKVVPLVFHNDGVRDGVPRFTPPRPIGGSMVYFPAGPSADYDQDGRLDLFLVNWFQGNRCRLLRNEGPQRAWLQVSARGRTSNRAGIGTKVRVYRAGQLGQQAGLLGYQEIATGYGYASGQPAVCHFGLADAATVDLEATYPSGLVVRRTGVTTRARLTIEEPE